MSDPQTTAFSRQDSEPLSMNDFWQEVEHIKQTRYSDVEECSSSEPNTPEEGEAEEDWLQDTGLSPLIGDQTPVEDNVLLLSTLTRTQTAAVQRRLDSYSCSLRKRCKQPTRDVREVFDVTRIQDCLPEENGVSDKRAPPLVNGNNLKPSPNHLKVSEASNILYTDVAYSEQAAFGPKAESKTSLQPESLPNINIYKGRLGVTRVSDLSPLDVKPIPSLALIELTALFDVLDLELKRNKAVKRKAAEGRLFGVMLNALLEQDQKVVPHARIPLILEAILTCLEKKGLTVQGILRVPGAQARIKTLQQRLERDFYGGLICWDDVNPHDASGLLKLFLRELPAPLLTAEYLPAFSAVQNISDTRQKLQALNLLVLVLPEPNRHTLKALLEFLHKVASHEKSNLMSMWNIATIIAPNLFLYRGSNLKSVEGGGKQQAEGVAGVVMAMVRYQDLLWTVPTFLLSQVRKLNESRSKRSAFGDQKIRNFLRKIHKDKEKQEKNQTEPCKQVKVRTPLFVRDTLVIQLNEETRASDVLQQFQKQMTQRNWQMNNVASMKCNGPIEFPKLDLYEVGGNICERCLDPDTYLLDLQTVNPNGEWVIKARHPSPPVL
ncbi:rho GTPase-activating protein 40 [Spea bombifrons]|uniref:rho GTPase-activating protein 40 n=1 Tax=Spea bombifrons TaxID=233779 RepID=UPI00234B8DA9|nr:rho GTPase-activating protein 40 [Spea bombifrons]